MNRYENRLRNKKSRLTDVIFVISVLFLAVITVFALYSGAGTFKNRMQKNNQIYSISELWLKQNYSALLELTEARLRESPLDPTALLYAGHSHFLLALSRVSVENRNADLDMAIYYLRQLKALPGNSMDKETDYVLGKAYFFKGRYWSDMAIKYLKASYDLGNRAPDILEFIGRAYSRLGDIDMAYKWYKIAEKKHPTDRLSMTLGDAAFKIGRYDEAAAYYIRSIENTKDDELKKSGLLKLGQLYYDVGNYAKGLEALKELVDIEEKNYEYWFLLGEIYYALDNVSAARVAWHRVTRIYPRHIGALRRLYN